MIDGLATAIIAASLVVAVWCAVTVALNRPTNDPLLYAVAIIEVALLVQVGIAIVRMATSDAGPEDVATFVGYLLVAPLVLPVGFFLSLVERTRWGTAIVAAAGLVLPVLVVRLQDLWSAGG